MLYNFYEFVHNNIDIHFWDLPALLAAVVLIVILIVHSRNQKKRDDDFDKKRNEKLEALANKAADGSANA